MILLSYDSDPMFRHYRQRRGPYAMAEPSRGQSPLKGIIFLFVVLFLIYLVGKWLLGLVGFGRDEKNAVVLLSSENGTVNVSLDGGLMQRALDEMKVQTGDRVSTGNDGSATLTFADGTLVRLDEQTEVTIAESVQGSEQSRFDVELTKGNLWVKTPSIETMSGTLARTVSLPTLTYSFPTDAEALVRQDVILVFSGEGEGVTVTAEGRKEPFFIGEGQQWTVPSGGTVSGDPLRFRSAIDPLVAQSPFVLDSRQGDSGATGSGSTLGASDSEIISVTAPAENQTVTTATVKVQGTIGEKVDRVRVNSYLASVDTVNRTFSQELAVADGETMAIRVEALDEKSVILQTITRTVKKGVISVTSPAITLPAKTGEMYRTSKTEITLQGTAPVGTQGIMVNDYRLQLFQPGNTTWSYLASTQLQNLKQGENIFDVYALDAAGNKSAPARVTIVVGQGGEGVVTGGGNTSSVAVIDESTLPKNAPLTPGVIAVTGPTPGASHTSTGSELLIEGTTSKETTNVWVNGYRLQLFKSGGGYWNYIANAAIGTLKRGSNVYKITARNSKDEILDTFEYTVIFNP